MKMIVFKSKQMKKEIRRTKERQKESIPRLTYILYVEVEFGKKLRD